MAIHLLTRRSTSNLYESFFDLIFCCLVIFIVLVLALITSVEDRVESLKDEQQAVASTLADITGTTRFTGGQGVAAITFIWDTTKEPPQLWPLPFNLRNYNMDYGNEELNNAKLKLIRTATKKLVKEVQPMTLEDAVDVVNSISPFVMPEVNDAPRLGVLLSQHTAGLALDSVFDGSPYLASGGNAGDVILAVDEQRLSGTHEEKMAALTNNLRVKNFGDTVSLSVSLPTGEQVTRVVLLKRFTSMIPTYIEVHSMPNGSLLIEGLINEDGTLANGRTQTELSVRLQRDRQLLDRISQIRSYQRLQEPVDEISPLMRVEIDSTEHELIVGKTRLGPAEFRNLTASIFGAPLVIQFENETAAREEWVREEVLIPSGFVNKSPRPVRSK